MKAKVPTTSDLIDANIKKYYDRPDSVKLYDYLCIPILLLYIRAFIKRYLNYLPSKVLADLIFPCDKEAQKQALKALPYIVKMPLIAYCVARLFKRHTSIIVARKGSDVPFALVSFYRGAIKSIFVYTHTHEVARSVIYNGDIIVNQFEELDWFVKSVIIGGEDGTFNELE